MDGTVEETLASGRAARMAGEARALGRAHGAVELEMFGLATEGLALVDEGDVARGMRCLAEAAAAALAGEYESLAPAARTCCRLISACELVRDYQRGAQWCWKVAEFSARMDTRFVTGVCRAHYAAILTWHGSWQEAERELVAASQALQENRPVWLPEALVRLGELRRRQGRLDDAEELFGRAPEHPLAQQGLAELSLDRGDPATARDLLERQLRRVPRHSRTARTGALELLVRAGLARVGATALAAAAEAVLADAGVRVSTDGPLTARQLEVLRLVAEGLADKEIATRLTLSEHTVHRHVANI